MTQPAAPLPPILIVATGHTFPHIAQHQGDFSDWMATGLGPDTACVHWDATDSRTPAPVLTDFAGVVLTGSHAMVTDRAPWSEALAAQLRSCVHAGTPVLGICYGHQLLAHALGGQVAPHPQGWEIGSHAIDCTPDAAHDPLFAAMPAQFMAQLVHRQSVRSLPPGVQVLARNAHEPHQAFRAGRCAWGVQFHPEFGAHAMQAYVDHLGHEDSILAHLPPMAVHPTPEAAQLLRRFAHFCTRTQAVH